jgi:uncharacterized membrane protein
MSIVEGETVTPHRLSRGLLAGVLISMGVIITFVLVVVYLFDWETTCTGGDVSDGPEPGSDQARMCDAWGGNVAVLFWIAAGLGLVIAIAVGVLWTLGRIHGGWVPVAVAAMVLSPVPVAEVLTSPSGTLDQHTDHEGSAMARRTHLLLSYPDS